jgi:glycosyltransferase involved in cell wall biosynthesis
VLSYGLRVPPLEEHAIGGIIKLQHLRRMYAEDDRRFNVLYLVSSRLPEAAVTVARWAHRKGARVVLNQNGVAYPAWYGPGWERENAPIAALLEMADHVFYQSEFCRASADRFAGPARRSAEVLFNPVDTTRFVPLAKPQSAHALTLLLAGSQDQWYRFESAVKALARLRANGIDAELLVTGRLGWRHDRDTARREAMTLLDAHRVAACTTLIGPYTQAEAPGLYQRADLVLHTKYNDPCPTVVLEALSSGRPVVYSKSGGVPELVGSDAGIAIDSPLRWDEDVPPSPDALAEAVVCLQSRLDAARAAARLRAVTHFDVSLWLARHDALFRTLLRAA